LHVTSARCSAPGIARSTPATSLIAIALERFIPRQTFLERVGELLEWVRAAPRVEGGEAIRYPGEIRPCYAAAYGRDGIPCDEAMERAIDELTVEFGVRWPC